jgi:peptidoglycan/LPS O-acetylase OafA/YrhL
MVAAAAVYMSHVPQPKNLNPTVATFMSAGYNGVTLFFVLSGFVLGLNYFDRLATPSVRGIWNYAVARFARIYPLYLAILLYVVVQLGNAGISLSGLGLHLAGLQAWSPSLPVQQGFNAPAWSLSVELFLYACFPVLVICLVPLRRKTLLVGAALVLCVLAVFTAAALFVQTDRDVLAWTNPASAHRWLYTMPLTRLGDFTAGILLSCLFRTFGSHRRVTTTAPWFAVIGTLAMVGLMCSKQNLFSAWSWDAAYLVPTLAIIWGLAAAGSRSWLASGVMVAAGEASYAFYLVHRTVMFRLGAAGWEPVTKSVTGWSLSLQVMTFFFIIAIALGLHHMIERPARIWVNRHASVPIRTDAPTGASTRSASPATGLGHDP